MSRHFKLFCLALLLVLAPAWFALSEPPAQGQKPASEESRPARVDQHGDPLPEMALARIGTVRYRYPGVVGALACSPDSLSAL